MCNSFPAEMWRPASVLNFSGEFISNLNFSVSSYSVPVIGHTVTSCIMSWDELTPLNSIKINSGRSKAFFHFVVY